LEATRIRLAEGVHLTYLPARKFKTSLLSAQFVTPLRWETAGANALLAAVLLCAEGPGSIEDVIFERRFGCAAGFERLGAKVQVNGRTLCIRPGGVLRGTELAAPDLRGGAALVVAALAASGTSVIGHPEHIDRGYAAFTEILSSLGAQIRREERSRNPSAKKTSSKKQNHLAIGTKRWYDTVI